MPTCMTLHVFCGKTVFIKTPMKDYELHCVQIKKKKPGFI